MSTFFEIAYNIIAPVFLIVGVAVLVDRRLHIDPRPLSRLIVYLFTPFMVLDGIANSNLTGSETGQIVVVALSVSLLMALVGWIVARAIRLDQRMVGVFVLSVTLINAGNYGIPLNRFAFGDAGEARAMIYFVMTVAVSNTLGIFLASSGTVSARRAVGNVLRVPLPYAVVLGFVLNAADITLPVPVARATEVLGQAAIPAMLTVLGLQLSQASLQLKTLRPALLAAGMRLTVAPMIALVMVALIGLSGVTRQVSLVQASMPTAVISGVLATEFGGREDAEFVTSVIVLSTALSMLTLSVLLTFVM
ncbi:MAG: AEC family transporter [Chloroflexi bacterium]|nr:AEC family transporter [Chloroflexota bacterium]